MRQQLSFADIEYGKRRRITKREEFLNKKDIFGWRKARYRGIQQNEDHAYLAFASAKLYMLTQYV